MEEKINQEATVEEEASAEVVQEENPSEEVENTVPETEEPVVEEKSVSKKDKVFAVVKKLANRWFIDAFSGMALGLFCTLIAGTIICMVAGWIGIDNGFGKMLNSIGSIAKSLMGVGIGVGIAFKLKAKPLVVFSAAVTGFLGAWAMNVINGTFLETVSAGILKGLPGNPIGSYVVALFTVEIASLYAGKTKFDIIFIPIGMMLLSMGAIYLAWPFIQLIDLIAKVLVLAIGAGTAVKIIVGIFVAVVMGILLTMPTSSAAIWVAIATSATAVANPEVFSIAGGAAVAGCAAHMVGFAVASFRENGWSGLVSQGLGTSMLQIPNIMKHPLIMVPEIVASAISGLVAVLLDMRCNASGGGMGTSGLVGLFGVIDASQGVVDTWRYALGIVLCLFIIPAGVSLGVSELMRKKNWIKAGEQKLE